jgi:hypothetical protein
MDLPQCLSLPKVHHTSTSSSSTKRSTLNSPDSAFSPGSSRERRCEVGYLTLKKPLAVYLIFEGFPVWVFLLDLACCSHLYIVGYTSLGALLDAVRVLGRSTAVLEFQLAQFLRVGGLSFIMALPSEPPIPHDNTVCILLVSGPLQPFLCHQLSRRSAWVILGVVDQHFSGRLRSSRPTGTSSTYCLDRVTWTRVRHVSTGGPTEFVSLFGCMGVQIEPMVTTLRRTIRCILDFSIRPNPPIRLPAQYVPHPQFNVYTLGDTLRPGWYHVPVRCPSSFHASGWGSRILSLAELASAYGFPREIPVSLLALDDFLCPPLQLLESVFQPCWAALSSSLDRTPSASPLRSQAVVPELNRSWLPHLGRYLSHAWIDLTLVTSLAAKVDKASVPSHLWDNRLELLYPGSTGVLPRLRSRLLIRSCRRLLTEIRTYLASQFGSAWSSELRSVRSDFAGGGRRKRQHRGETTRQELLQLESSKCGEVLEKWCLSSWWDWEEGSSLFFWRWGDQKVLARDGMVPFIQGVLPRFRQKARAPTTAAKRKQVAEKLKTIIKRKYIAPGFVTSLRDVFAVPKGADIRLVYNGTSCGLNQATWAPNFWLPYPRSALRLLDFGYYSVDVDLGEMFLNFPLHLSIQPYSGIDLTGLQTELELEPRVHRTMWMRWTRNWMGARMSPFSSVQFCHFAEEFCRGLNTDNKNELRWHVIVLNLPGSPTYDPSRPRVYKWDSKEKRIAGDFIIFVDDVRATGQTTEHAWGVSRQVVSRFQFLGVQDASRKRKPPSQTPGAWAGAVFASTADNITKTVSREKWIKGKVLVRSLFEQLFSVHETDKYLLNYKELEVTRGFLGHLSSTYESMVPYLKGFHLTLASHLGKRDQEGWKLTDQAWQSYVDKRLADGEIDVEEAEAFFETVQSSDKNQAKANDVPLPPKEIAPVTQLRDDVFALHHFFECADPPIIHDRCFSVQVVRYGFGDASGTGFGSTIQTANGLKFRIGVWGSDDEGESSNYKELENVVSTIEEEVRLGSLKNSVLFFFTDNTTVESALHKGNSSSRRLFELVVRFRKMEFDSGLRLVISHVSGKRMIAQGTDGVSRGNLKEGVAGGDEMLSFVPLHLSALERHLGCETWLSSWIGSEMEVLSPTGWYLRGHDLEGGSWDKQGFWRNNTRSGVFLWAPAPAAAEIALEQLRQALIKRQKSTHVFVCPRLLTGEWMRQLYKCADFLVSLPPGVVETAWPLDMYEPLTIAIVFPMLRIKPWKRAGTPKMFGMARKLYGMWKTPELDSRHILCKFFEEQRALSGEMSECMVRKVLYYATGSDILCEDTAD